MRLLLLIFHILFLTSHLSHKFIAEAVNGLDKPGIFRIRFELLPQPRDMNVDRARRRHRVVAPNFVEQLIAGDDFTATPDQVPQDLEFAS